MTIDNSLMKIKIFSAHVPTYFGALHSTHTNYKSTLVVFLAALHLDTCLICTLRWTWVVQLCSQALKPIHKQQQHVMKSRWKTKPVWWAKLGYTRLLSHFSCKFWLVKNRTHLSLWNDFSWYHQKMNEASSGTSSPRAYWQLTSSSSL